MAKVVKPWMRRKLDRIASSLGIVYQEDWYNVSGKDVQNLGANFLSQHYKGSLLNALRDNYSEYEWNPFQFATLPHNYYQDQNNQRSALDWAAEKLGIIIQEDWYSVSVNDVNALGLSGLFSHYYNGSLFPALVAVYSEFEWDPYRFESIPRSHSLDVKKKKHRQVLDRIASRLQIVSQRDWYRITTKQFQREDSSFLGAYNGSLYNALKHVYSEFEWNPFFCRNLSGNILHQLDTQKLKEFMEETTQNLSIENWDSLSSSRAICKLSKKFGGKLSTLEYFYPEINWRLGMPYGSSGEMFLEDTLRRVSSHEVERQQVIEGCSIDVFIPKHSVAFEFQGQQHYHQTHTGSYLKQLQRDKKKEMILRHRGVTLIQVPYWWNKSFSSLYALIQRSTAKAHLNSVTST